MSRLVEGGVLVIIFFLVVNVLYLNMILIAGRTNQTVAATSSETGEKKEDFICDQECQSAILHQVFLTITPSLKEETIQKDTVHEFIIPIGNGTVKSKEYTAVEGAEVYLDTSLYPSIKTVIFETYMSIPTANGTAYAKLYNETDHHDVWFSEQLMETNKVIHNEKKVQLDKGKKLYKVMVKSTMGYEVILQNARIRITTQE